MAAIFQLYHDDQFIAGEKPATPVLYDAVASAGYDWYWRTTGDIADAQCNSDIEAVPTTNQTDEWKRAVSQCPTCGYSFQPIFQNGDAEKSINNYISDILAKHVLKNNHREENNNVLVTIDSENGRTQASVPDIISEVESIGLYYNDSVVEIDTVADNLVSKILEQQRLLKEQLRKTKREELFEVKNFLKTVKMKPEEDQDIQNLIHQELESTFETEDNQQTKADETDGELKPEPIKTIDVKLPGEGHVAIQDLIVMNLEGRKVIVVSDYMNSCVKCIYVDEKETDCLKFPQPPFYLTQASDTSAATSFGRVKRLAIFQVVPELQLERIIDTQIEYSGLQRLSASTFAASRACAFKNGIIDIIDLSGTVLRSFGSDILAAPYFIDIAGCGRIIVSDSSRRSIICFTSKGQIRFMYRPTDEGMLSCPRGLKRHKDRIYVVDEDGNKVIQLTERGEFVKDVLTSEDSLNVPRAIDVDDDNMLYVSVQERYIKIFQLP